jgi:hypothetical protein
MPHSQPAPATYPQPVYQPPARQVTTLPRPQIEAPKPTPPQPGQVATLPQPERMEVLPVDVPSPQQLGIRLEEPAVPPIVIPDPAKLGIKGE